MTAIEKKTKMINIFFNKIVENQTDSIVTFVIAIGLLIHPMALVLSSIYQQSMGFKDIIFHQNKLKYAHC